MRNENEVMNQILEYAENNEMVRAVILNGSRANPNLKNDIFSDYDVVFLVKDPTFFLEHQDWIQHFGKTIIMQQNSFDDNGEKSHIFLMIFEDGVRIDLFFRSIKEVNKCLEDSLKVTLLDKDNILPEFDPATEEYYYTKKPTKQKFEKDCNNFWWCSTYVAKSIWRDQLSYAKYIYDVIMKDHMRDMISWYIGSKKNWEVNSGSLGKHFKQQLPEELWNSFEKTYSGSNYEEIWESLFEAGKLFRKIGLETAEQLGYEYPFEDDEKVTEYLKKIKELPKDAKTIV
ncbi:aminoglycoside 6-adenylyltransferase [Chengkuizengella axinellae]|uniref:Aminoglycoside 6-adenylyltransferase n=1 Tax=Chengkuizengella axinellae TaxID=3064388 RepID=A0ABT9IY01_9BACL|nr:aminoglycoside 6-adenylyltransferase [Chengkuizengella sp. 2205SS18-9]MDP5274188.1 aminoglycoside 6-adenylyltransferase [Chengkuizengella sp. 2205SS18-9]